MKDPRYGIQEKDARPNTWLANLRLGRKASAALGSVAAATAVYLGLKYGADLAASTAHNWDAAETNRGMADLYSFTASESEYNGNDFQAAVDRRVAGEYASAASHNERVAVGSLFASSGLASTIVAGLYVAYHNVVELVAGTPRQ